MSADDALNLSQRRIHLWTPLGANRLEAVEVKGYESLSHPYRFDLKLRTDPAIGVDLKQLVGAPARISFQLPDPRWASLLASAVSNPTKDFCGILSDVSFDGTDDDYAHYSATLRPRIWELGLNVRYRLFLQKTTQEIVTAVLDSLPARWELAGSSITRQYCVQYGESDLQFLSRLLEEDGLFYFFEHQYDDQPSDPTKRSERIVITDGIDRVNDDSIPRFELDTVGGGNRSSMRIRRWRTRRRMIPQRVVSLDRNFQRPQQLVEDHHDLTDQTPAASATVTAYPSGVAWRIDEVSPAGDRDASRLDALNTIATTDARQRSGRLAFLQEIIDGGGDVATLSPAGKFQVVRDRLPDPHPHYITSIEHEIRLANPVRSGSGHPVLEYRNEFHCQLETVPFQPARKTPKPQVHGVVPATVVADPSITNDDVCVDAYGRVKVRFPWQAANDSPGCWIRVAQIWAGPRWGAFFWPRVGHEVLIAFEHGDPDRPVIVGSVYNGQNLPPLPLPEHKLSGGIHSCTHKGDPTRQTSCVVFHDRPGQEYLQLHSETYHSLSCETETLKWAAGHDIEFKGHNWIFDLIGGSGGGGSDFTGYDGGANAAFKKPEENESPDVAEIFADIFAIGNKGSTTYSVGDAYTKRFGRQFESYYGCNIWVGCDPVEFVEFMVDKLHSPIASALVPLFLGAGGQGKTLLGGTHNLQFGTDAKIHEGRTITRTGPRPGAADDSSEHGNSTVLDGPTRTVVHVLLGLILTMDLLIMLLTKAALSRDGKHWKGYLQFSEIWSLMILPRLQGLLEFLATESTEMNEVLARAKKFFARSSDAVSDVERAVTSTDPAAPITRARSLTAITSASDEARRVASMVAAATRPRAGSI